VGDKVYVSKAAVPPDPLLDRFPRQALHARRLGFTHPSSGVWLEFESPVPDDFARLLHSLRQATQSTSVPSSPP
jgi:23S rRNA pseudouridine1911/1915/1917 synthase